MKFQPFKDTPGRCLKCDKPLKLNKQSAYCSEECDKADQGYYTKMVNSKIGAEK